MSGAVERCHVEVDGTALGRIYRALDEHGCRPEWTHDGRGIVATCPNCGGVRSLHVEVPRRDEVPS